MAAANFDACRAFVWRKGFDDPKDGCHVTPHDPGGATYGGVTHDTWAAACHARIVVGPLQNASTDQLSDVLRATCWHPACDLLPAGIDLILFNGKMMSGWFPHLFQQALGFMADDVDGWVGPQTMSRAQTAEPATLINAACGAHYAYLTRLPIWGQFGDGWTVRLMAAQTEALALAAARPAR